jgi:uncharacterized membrane protein
MNAIVFAGDSRFASVADNALKATVRAWFLVTVFGQALFALYVTLFYGSTAAHGDLAKWKKVLSVGYVAGDAMGNLALMAHLLLAVIVTVGGPLQLVPEVRARAPSFHRWNGRVYLVAAVTTAIAGLYMELWRSHVGSAVMQAGGSLNAVLILACAAMALRYALARDFRTHRRWALRLFLVVSASWFFRVELMFWIAINGGPVGFDPKTFMGPATDIMSFTQYLLPLAVLEIYLRVQRGAGTAARLATAGGLALVTLATGIGMFVAFKAMWLTPMLRAVA